jgi:hypothetical protein
VTDSVAWNRAAAASIQRFEEARLVNETIARTSGTGHGRQFQLFSGGLSWGDPMFGFGFAVLLVILWARFGLGCLKLDIPYDVLKVSRGRIVSTRLLSVGFLMVALAALANPFFHLPQEPLPLGVLFCAPGLIAIHRLRRHLETRGNQAKPAMAWLDRGVVAGWTALCSDVVWWFFATLPMLPSIP